MDTTTKLADAAVHAKQSLAQNLRTMIDETDQLLKSAVHTGDQKFDSLRDSFTAQVRHMREQLDEIETNALHQAKKHVREADRTVREHPYSAMGIAAAVGLLVGFLSGSPLMDATAPISGGLLDTARRVAHGMIEAGRTRLELAALELEEERLRLVRLAIAAAVALFLLFTGIAMATAWIVMFANPEQRLALLGAGSSMFLVAAATAAWRWRVLSSNRVPLLHATLEELRRDARALNGEEDA